MYVYTGTYNFVVKQKYCTIASIKTMCRENFLNSAVTVKMYIPNTEKSYALTPILYVYNFYIHIYIYMDITIYIISASTLEKGEAEYFLLSNYFIHIILIHCK